MFHQINELMVLGMHPAIQYPRRNQIRPRGVEPRTGSSVLPNQRQVHCTWWGRENRGPAPV